MKRKFLQALSTFILLCIIDNAGSTAEYKTISVQEAVSIALTNNHDYRIAEHKLKEADEKINAVWGELFPVLESEASMMRQGAETGFMTLSDGQLDLKFVQMRFGLNPGIFYNSLQASRKAFVSSKEDVRKIKSETELEVIKSYFSVILFEEMISLRKESIELFKSNLKDIQRMYSTGSIAKFDLMQAKVQLNSQVPLLLEAENNYRTALDYFNYVLGSNEYYKTDLSVIEKTIEKISADDMEKKIDLLTSTALKNRPEIVQIQKKIEASENKVNMYEAYYIWPTFTAGGYYGMSKSDSNPIDLGIAGPVQPDMTAFSGDGNWQNVWQINVAATYRWGSLFQVDSNSARAREEEEAVKQAGEEMMKLKRLISINISSGYSKLLTSYLTILSQKENVETADEGLRIAKESFRAGVIKNSDLISSEYSLTAAKTGYINAINSYYTALAELKKESGLNDISIIFEQVKQ